ncbi:MULTISPECIES: Sec-independent protein translocase protein TatB [Novosphingobium]|uniref:Sec-independent protein translocase protein TatB n=1 Tax=Novosphingobium mathurense TaxID=428990 RepID=A0A1U6IH15_9SPHN|nr:MULTISPECIES: Sec-independent protein translocase protein TatB [Novosphingobium]CDO37291.1 Sec-independent protein translocase protein tatB homolog [Novosphingobium sp. KN65.2]SLK07307.1 sec-independent protein translocase protein TatB [Novosphingobium mathurense]
MFDIGASELLMVIIVAVVVIGPKDMPMAMRTAGRWIGKMRKISGHFRAGIDAMVREAELEEMEKQWRAQNEAIMKATPQLPSAEEMQAPIASRQDKAASASEATPSEAGATDGPPPQSGEQSAAQDEAPRDAKEQQSRQAELNLPPPPP